jgi:hypothetical protein
MKNIKKGFFTANNLPIEWGSLYGDHPLFTRQFLAHLEKTNAVDQKYYLLMDDAEELWGACFYRGILPMRFGPIVVKPKTTFCSLPMPFHSEKGFRPEGCINKITILMDDLWPGFQLIVGMKSQSVNIPGWTWKRQLVTVSQSLNYESFEHYTKEMRSRYRNKLIVRRKKWKGIEISQHTGNDFDLNEYKLYYDLLKNVQYPTEVMSCEFFQEMPLPHLFIKAQRQDIVLAWALLIPFGKELYMLFCGINRKYRNQYDSYHNLLCEVVKFGIAGGYNKLYLGQTAEIAKIEIGGVPEERYMLMRHTNPLINSLIGKTPFFSNRINNPEQHLFRYQN